MFTKRLTQSLFSRSFSVTSRALLVKKSAPIFEADAVFNKEFKRIGTNDYLGKWLVLFFYPLDFTFVCPTEIIEFSERHEEFKKLDADVVGVSVDSKFSHLAWINTPRKEGGLGEMKIALVSDLDKSISRKYGVLFGEEIALRGTFIIDPKGIVRQSTINDLSVGRNVDETLRLLEATQFADKHGEVCPVGWKRGDKTMKGDPEKSKEYFKSAN